MKWEEVVDSLGARKFLKTTPPTFLEYCKRTVNFPLHDWQVQLCGIIQDALDTPGSRLILHAPPRYGKSIWTGQRLPAYAIGRHPDWRVSLACYNISHASDFGDVVLGLVKSSEHMEMFPNPDGWVIGVGNKEKFSTPARKRHKDADVSFKALGLLSGYTGKGSDLLIVDDPYASAADAESPIVNEAVWRWWASTAKLRINENDTVICLFHRYHGDDLAARLLADDPRWKYHRFPAIADGKPDDPTDRAEGTLLSPMRSMEFLRELEEKDPYVFWGMYQGLPQPPGGGFIKPEWFKEVETIPKVERWVRFWDLAWSERTRADYTVGALCGVDQDQNFYIRDIVRYRKEWADSANVIEEVCESDFEKCQRDGVDYCIGVEQVSGSSAAISDMMRMKRLAGIPLWPQPIKAREGKKVRASGWVRRAELGYTHLISGDWVPAFKSECSSFDGLGIAHDDQVDAVSGAFNLIWWLRGDIQYDRTPQKGTPAWYEKIEREGFPDEERSGWDTYDGIRFQDEFVEL